MGEARRRRQLDPTFGEPSAVSLASIPAEWSLLFVNGLRGQETITIWQGSQQQCEEAWMRATKAHPSTLSRLNKNGFLVVAHPQLLIQFVLLEPQKVQSFLSLLLATLRLRQITPYLIHDP